LALLSKYTGFFLGLGALAWLVFVPRARPWLLSPWSYFGAALALVIFAPNLWWNATHGWMTFAFQFGRIGAGHFTLRFLAEFLGAQLALATPFLFLCIVWGVSGSVVAADARALLAAIVLPAVAYFVLHSLHDRVQGNWPCFLYPALAIAAADAMRRAYDKGWAAGLVLWSARLAVPTAFVLLAACYAQAFFGVVPLGRNDPFSRLLGVGFADVARQTESAAAASHAVAILTTDYASTGWFAFYTHLPVVQINEEKRWLAAPRATAGILDKPLLYIAEQRLDRHDVVAAHFLKVDGPTILARARAGTEIARYALYRVSGPQGLPVGRQP
jgi:4-amino-4-deoxy-L-arabinose transferase-like glycosyltransferase